MGFENHELIFLGDNPFPVYRLKDPEYERMQGCLLIFSVEGIVIVGDLTPDRHWNSAVSSMRSGYGIQWFAGDLSEMYLAEKFLHKEFLPETAQETVKELLEYEQETSPDSMSSKMREALALNGDYPWVHSDICEIEFAEWYYEVVGSYAEDIGFDYDPDALRVLTDIQRRFRELWHEMPGQEKETA